MSVLEDYQKRKRKEAQSYIDAYATDVRSKEGVLGERIDRGYREGVGTATASYHRAKKDTAAYYRSLYDANAVDELVRQREAKERVANLGLARSGLPDRLQSGIQRQRRQIDARITRDQQEAVRALDDRYQAVMTEYGAWRDSEKRRVSEAVQKSIDDATKAYTEQADKDARRLYEEDQRNAQQKVTIPTVTVNTPISTGTNPVISLLDHVEGELNKNTKDGMTAAWNIVMQGYRDGTLTRTLMNDVLRDYGILSPSQQEYYTDRAGDFRYEKPMSVERLRKTAEDQRASEISPSSVDTAFIRRFFEDHNAMVESLQSLNYDNAAALASSEGQRSIDLRKRGAAVLSFLEEYRTLLGEEQYQTLTQAVNEALQNQTLMGESFRSFADTVSQYATKAEYEQAPNIYNIHQMSLEELDAKLKETDPSKEAIKPLEARIREIDSEINRFPNTARNAKAKARLKELNAEKRALQEKINGIRSSAIAYTTSDGENTTWQQLYDAKQQQEAFDALYQELSLKSDWAEKSRFMADDANGQSRRFNADNTALKDEELEVYNYLFNTKGETAAREWAKQYKRDFRDRKIGQSLKAIGDWASERNGAGDFFVVAPLSVVANLTAPIEYGVDLVKNAFTGEMDSNYLSDVTSVLRSAVSDKHDWMVGDFDAHDFLFHTGMSMAESGIAATVPFGLGAIPLGMSAAASATNDALDRGLDTNQAVTNGIFAGVFEALLERIAIGNFKASKASLSAGGKDIAKNVVKSIIVNASEEAATEIANIAYDTIVNGDFSHYETAIRQYMAAGMSEKDAKTEAAKMLGGQIGEAMASGALIGAGFGGISAISGYRNASAIGKALRADGMDAALIERGQTLEKGSQAQKLAGELALKETVTDAEIGKLYGLVVEQIQAETAAQQKNSNQEEERTNFSPTVNELLKALQAGVEGQTYIPDGVQDSWVTDPKVAELLEAFKAGVDGKRYVPGGQELVWDVDNHEPQRYNDGEMSDVQPAKLSSASEVDELLEAFTAGMEGRKYEPKNTVALQSIEEDIARELDGETIIKSVGAKSITYPNVEHPYTKQQLEFVAGTTPVYPPDHTMAGYRCKTGRKIDDIDRLVRENGGASAEKWQKEKARYQVYDEYGEIREVELHWYQHEEVGRIEYKVKTKGGTMFVDEW